MVKAPQLLIVIKPHKIGCFGQTFDHLLIRHIQSVLSNCIESEYSELRNILACQYFYNCEPWKPVLVDKFTFVISNQ